MSRTATQDSRAVAPEPVAPAPQLAPPPKLRRRPALVAGAVVAICIGALLAAWTWTATTHTQQVLVARHTIERGSLIEADDLARVQLSADPALHPVAGDELDEVVGQRAALDIAAGAMLTPDSFTSTVVPDEGTSVVGIALSAAQAPGLDLASGDQVRIVVTPAVGAEVPGGAPLFNQAQVVGVHLNSETGQTIVDLLVPHGDAATLATRIATGSVALVLDSRDR